ncbi:MAG: hypothetical protein ACJ75S_05970 [Solirubrobacterales bacterium]
MVCPLALTYLQSGYVLAAIPLFILPIAAIAFARSGKAWQSIGRGPYAIDPDLPPRSVRPAASPVNRATRETEVRQMLRAKSYRRERRGEAPLDVEAEAEHRVADFIGLDG